MAVCDPKDTLDESNLILIDADLKENKLLGVICFIINIESNTANVVEFINYIIHLSCVYLFIGLFVCPSIFQIIILSFQIFLFSN